MDKIIIFDTTLRDGEQSPGASLEKDEKLEIAKQLKILGVDAIEAGFPISSPGDFNAVKLISQKVRGPIICGLARCMEKDIKAAAGAVKPAQHPRIHVFLATSKIHMKYKLQKAEDEILRLAVWGAKLAKQFVDDVEFSPEDASRSEKEFLYRVIEAVIDVGATTINVPDTVGYAIPDAYGRLIHDIRNNVPNINKAVISVHCHNDLGLAVANSLSAVKNGAGQVECTINGIGERAGNASLEEVVMAIKTRQDFFNCSTSINTKELCKTSHMVSKLTGVMVPLNKAVVGINAFSHESGIHQDGVLKERGTYEIMSPLDVGFGESRLVLGKHSGRHALNLRLVKLGYKLNEAKLVKVFEAFKALADKKKEVFDEDLRAIVEEEGRAVTEKYKLHSFEVTTGTNITPEALVRLREKSKTLQAEASGDGPIDACYNAIDKIAKIKGKLLDYSIKSVTSGKDALGEVSVKVSFKDKVVSGRGTDTDIIQASVKAYLNAVNKVAK
jgi:2-isopropylmalate synthase